MTFLAALPRAAYTWLAIEEAFLSKFSRRVALGFRMTILATMAWLTVSMQFIFLSLGSLCHWYNRRFGINSTQHGLEDDDPTCSYLKRTDSDLLLRGHQGSTAIVGLFLGRPLDFLGVFSVIPYLCNSGVSYTLCRSCIAAALQRFEDRGRRAQACPCVLSQI